MSNGVLSVGGTSRKDRLHTFTAQVCVGVRSVTSDALGLMRENKKTTALVIAALFLFYWYEIRPVQIYRSCALQSSFDAKNLLKSKALIAPDAAKKASYDSLIERNMYLRSDYESFYGKCLRYYGMGN